MSKAENGALFVLDVMRGCYRNVGVTQHFLGGSEPIAGIDLASVFLPEGVQRSSPQILAGRNASSP